MISSGSTLPVQHMPAHDSTCQPMTARDSTHDIKWQHMTSSGSTLQPMTAHDIGDQYVTASDIREQQVIARDTRVSRNVIFDISAKSTFPGKYTVLQYIVHGI